MTPIAERIAKLYPIFETLYLKMLSLEKDIREQEQQSISFIRLL